MNNNIRGAMLPFSLRQTYFRHAMVWYTLLLLSANFVGDRSFQLFYFSYSAGTLVIQFVFCWIIGFSETLGFRRTTYLIWSSSLVNLAVAFIAYFLLQFPIPEFWINPEDGMTVWHRLNMVIMLTVGYTLSALAMVFAGFYLKLILGNKWLISRVSLTLLVGLVVDIVVLMPILYFLAPDKYLALWKMLSLISVKLSLNIMAIPVCYVLIQVLKKRSTYFRTLT